MDSEGAIADGMSEESYIRWTRILMAVAILLLGIAAVGNSLRMMALEKRISVVEHSPPNQ